MAGISLRERKTNDWLRKLTRKRRRTAVSATEVALGAKDREDGRGPLGEKGYRVAAKNRKAGTRKAEKAM